MATYDYSNKVVIFPNDDNSVAVLYPAPECSLSLEQIIDKDIPTGKPHQILQDTDLPSDHTYFNAWTYEEN